MSIELHPRAGTGSGAAGGGLGQIVQTVSDLKQGLFDKESGALSGLLGGGGEGGLGNPIQEAKSLLGEGLGGLVGADSRQGYFFKTKYCSIVFQGDHSKR